MEKVIYMLPLPVPHRRTSVLAEELTTDAVLRRPSSSKRLRACGEEEVENRSGQLRDKAVQGGPNEDLCGSLDSITCDSIS